MIRLRSAALALVLALVCVPVCARAATVQVVKGASIQVLATPVSKSVHLTGDAQLVQAYPVPDQMVPPGHIDLVPESAIATATYVNVPIEIELDGKFLRQIFVGYRVERYVQTAVATRDLVPGAVLAESDLKMARIVYTGQRTNGTDVLIGRRIIAAVRAGAPVTIESTRVDQIVKAGSTVQLIVDSSGVRLATDVVARTSGGLGDQVNLYNPQTNKTLTGTVIGPDRVELNLTGETQ